MITVIKSTDVGAPAITGAAGGIFAALDFALVTGLGWTKPFIGTNKAVYRPALGTRFFMRVAQDGSDGKTTNRPAFYAYETMTDVDTGTGRFPSAIQVTTEMYISASTDTTPRPWIVIGDGSTAYMFVNDASSTTHNGLYSSFMFGDYTSFKPTTDDWKCLLIGANAGQAPLHTITGVVAGVLDGHYIPRGHTGLGSSVNVGKHTDQAKAGGQGEMGQGGIPFPNPIDGGIYMAPVYVNNGGSVYGKLRGIWAPLHNVATWPFNSGDTFQGTGVLTGKTFMPIFSRGGASAVCVEISNTWTA